MQVTPPFEQLRFNSRGKPVDVGAKRRGAGRGRLGVEPARGSGENEGQRKCDRFEH